MSRRGEWVAITLIMLLAAVLRFWMLGEAPPGLCHDEVANWLIARDILAGRHAIYFTAAYGHEPLYQYVQAATVALFGDHWLGLRYPSVALGLLGLAATYVFIRRLFDVPTALLAGGWLALSFWPLFYARVALRAITLPFTAALAAYFLLRATDPATNRPHSHTPNPPVSRSPAPGGLAGVANWLLAGFFLGLSLYTYMAARTLPVILALFLIYFFLISPSTPIPWSSILVFLLITAIVSVPLAIWLTTHPGAEYRIAEVQGPLDRLLAGDPSLVWQNLIANLKFFTCAGDPWPRQNLPGRPVFADPISAALFCAGLLIALWRWRDPRYGFLLVWLAGALVPSIVTSVAPSSIRNVLGLVVVFVFPALALVEAGRWLKQRMQDARWRIQDVRWRMQDAGRKMQDRCSLLPASCFLLPAACFLLLAPCFFLTGRDYFLVWPQNDMVRFDYQADLTAVAHRLDELPAGTPVSVAGLSVHTLDGPGLELAARRHVHDVRLCDARETLVVPAGHDAWLFVPQVVPFDVDLREQLLEWGAVVLPPWRGDKRGVSFTSYRLSDGADGAEIRRDLQYLETTAALPDGTPVAVPVSFDGRLVFLGYEWLQQSSAPGGFLTLLTYWRIEAPSSVTLKIFVHLIDDAGELVAQHDGLGSPPRGWGPGDLIVQRHLIPLPAGLPTGLYTPILGLYETQDPGHRLTVGAVDHLVLPSLEVASP